MGTLTESTTRLRDEIVASRQRRQTLYRELVRETRERQLRVFRLCSAWARARATARQAWQALAGAPPPAPLAPAAPKHKRRRNV